MGAYDPHYNPALEPREQESNTFTFHYLRLVEIVGLKISETKSHFPTIKDNIITVHREFGKRQHVSRITDKNDVMTTVLTPISSGLILDYTDYQGGAEVLIDIIKALHYDLIDIKNAWRICSATIINLYRNPSQGNLSKKAYANLVIFPKEEMVSLLIYIIYRLDHEGIYLDIKINKFISKLFETINGRKEVNAKDVYLFRRKDILNNILRRFIEDLYDHSSTEINRYEFLILNFLFGVHNISISDLGLLIEAISQSDGNDPMCYRIHLEQEKTKRDNIILEDLRLYYDNNIDFDIYDIPQISTDTI